LVCPTLARFTRFYTQLAPKLGYNSTALQPGCGRTLHSHFYSKLSSNIFNPMFKRGIICVERPRAPK
jgi:hypothetical protein